MKDQKRTVLQIRMSPEELKAAKALAEEQGVSISELVRALLAERRAIVSDTEELLVKNPWL